MLNLCVLKDLDKIFSNLQQLTSPSDRGRILSLIATQFNLFIEEYFPNTPSQHDQQITPQLADLSFPLPEHF